MDKRVLAFVDEAKRQGLPVTRSTIMAFGRNAKETVLGASDLQLTEADTRRLEAFMVSEKWAKNFINRNGLNPNAVLRAAAAAATAGGSSAYGEVGEQDGVEEEARSTSHDKDSDVLDEVMATAINNALAEQAERGVDSGDEPGSGQRSAGRRGGGNVNQRLSGEAMTPEEEKERTVSRPAPPPFSELAQHFSVLEGLAESCGIDDAVESLRRAKSAFIKARSSWLSWQAGERERQ